MLTYGTEKWLDEGWRECVEPVEDGMEVLGLHPEWVHGIQRYVEGLHMVIWANV